MTGQPCAPPGTRLIHSHGDDLHCCRCGKTWRPPKQTDASINNSVTKHWKECP